MRATMATGLTRGRSTIGRAFAVRDTGDTERQGYACAGERDKTPPP